MKLSFAVKLGALLLLVFTLLGGGLLGYFYSYSKEVAAQDLEKMLHDVAHTGSFVVNEEGREMIVELTNQLYGDLPAGFETQVRRFVQSSPIGSIQTSLSQKQSDKLQSGVEFSSLIQLLRRVKAGSGPRVSALELMAQTEINTDCRKSLSELVEANRQSSSVRWVYLMVPVPEIDTDDAVFFLADGNYESVVGDDVDDNPIGNLYRPKAFFSEAFKNGRIAISDWYTDAFDEASQCISVMTAAVPIKHESGAVLAVLGVDYPVMALEARIEQLESVSWQIFLAVLLISIVVTFVIAYWISVPLGRLRDGALELSKQNFKHRVSIRSNDEFGILANTVNEVSASLGDFTASLESMVAERTKDLTAANDRVKELNELLQSENAHLGAEVENLLNIRRQRLPYLGESIDVADYKLSFYSAPSKAVGGDFWQVISNNESTAQICFGEVAGYGLETATLALQLQSLCAADSAADVQTVIRRANRLAYGLASEDLPTSVAMLHLKITDAGLEIAGCGETPITFTGYSADEVNLAEMSAPLGLGPKVDAPSHRLNLREGQTLVVYSAGFRAALARFRNIQDLNVSADALVKMSGLREHPGSVLLDELQQQDWFETFNEDVSFIVIGRSSLA